MDGTLFHERLKQLINNYVHGVYRLTKVFPKDELYGATSQLRRSSLSIALNYIEGYARGRTNVHRNFLETSYGSLKESRYLIDFALAEQWIDEERARALQKQGDEIGAMLWTTIDGLKS
jgi:four helix bundle protein